MKMNRLYLRLLAILIALVLIALVGFRYIFRDSQEDFSGIKPKYTLSASELYSAFSTNEAEANQKYSGEVIEVYGKLTERSLDDWEQTFLYFIDPLFGVTVVIDSVMSLKQTDLLNALETGDEIRIKGRCDGMLTDVRISKSVLVD